MITLLLHLLRLLPFLCGADHQLAIENLALRHQLAVFKRTVTGRSSAGAIARISYGRRYYDPTGNTTRARSVFPVDEAELHFQHDGDTLKSSKICHLCDNPAAELRKNSLGTSRVAQPDRAGRWGWSTRIHREDAIMKDIRRSEKHRAWSIFRPILLIAIAALLAAASLVRASQSEGADKKHVELQSGPFAPGASGAVAFSVRGGVLSGHIEAEGLPAQGVHAFYVLWFVRTDTNDKAFLGPLVANESILFTKPGDGEMRFMAPAFTDGPNTGSPISLGTVGHNFFVVIAENQIDTFRPFPVSEPPSSFALTATF